MNRLTRLINLSQNLTVIETKSYFEAYRHILKALQRIPSNEQFPFADILLKLNVQPTPPDYITPTTTYNFTSLLSNATKLRNNFSKVTVLDQKQWPTNEQLQLNPKQYEALILALTNKVALIQGRKYHNILFHTNFDLTFASNF